MHFHARNKLKKEWELMVWTACKEAKLPKIDGKVEVFITYYHPKTNIDLDNFTPKFIMDGLKLFFEDDSIKYVKKLGWEFKKGEKCSIIKIKKR